MKNTMKTDAFTKILLVVVTIVLGNMALKPIVQIYASPDKADVLEILLEKDKIIETINRLFISTDNRDWANVKACFASNVLFDMTSMAGGEPVTLTSQEIVDSWDQGLKDLTAIHHQAGNFIVDISQNEADAFCYGIASHYLPNKTNQNTRIFVGSYDFHLTKDGENWRIDEFKFNLKYIDGNPNLEDSQ